MRPFRPLPQRGADGLRGLRFPGQVRLSKTLSRRSSRLHPDKQQVLLSDLEDEPAAEQDSTPNLLDSTPKSDPQQSESAPVHQPRMLQVLRFCTARLKGFCRELYWLFTGWCTTHCAAAAAAYHFRYCGCARSRYWAATVSGGLRSWCFTGSRRGAGVSDLRTVGRFGVDIRTIPPVEIREPVWTRAGSHAAFLRLMAAKQTLLDDAKRAAHVDEIRSGLVRRGDWECDAREALWRQNVLVEAAAAAKTKKEREKEEKAEEFPEADNSHPHPEIEWRFGFGWLSMFSKHATQLTCMVNQREGQISPFQQYFGIHPGRFGRVFWDERDNYSV